MEILGRRKAYFRDIFDMFESLLRNEALEKLHANQERNAYYGNGDGVLVSALNVSKGINQFCIWI